MANYGKNGHISFDRMWRLMKRKNFGKKDLREDGVHSNTVQKLVNDGNVTTEVIAHLCKLLDCQPGDIMEYVKEGD